MRVPRMTTRRWMAVVAVLSVALGGLVEARRMKRLHDDYRAAAARHAALETQHRRQFRRFSQQARQAARTPGARADEGAGPGDDVDRGPRLPGVETTSRDQDDRFRQAQARAVATVEVGRRIVAKRFREQAESDRRQAEYHAALGRKYAAAASRPWLSVEPDPPEPK